MRFEPFKVEHLKQIDLQEAQQYLRAYVDWDAAKQLEGPWASAAIRDDGRVLACGGLISLGGSCGAMWSYLDDEAGKHMVRITREARRLLRESPYKRVEAQADVGFDAAHRWLKALGFGEPHLKVGRRPDGGDAVEYVRFQ